MSPKTQFAVLGAGSWGSALAILLARNGHPVWLWGRDSAKMQALVDAQCNPWYLPDAHFPEGLVPTSDLNNVLATTSEVIMVTPSKVFRPILETVAARRPDRLRFAWATKGLEPETQRPFHEVAKEILGENTPTAVLSGPTFAREVALGLPTAITVASHFPEYANWLALCLSNSVLRPYTSEDVIGVEIGGAVKNVLAIAAGISDGLGFGDNARAALITRGLTEVMRLGEALGARRETLMGLSGLGDLVLTCTGDLSRNRRFGLLLGKGYSIDSALKVVGQVVEGFSTVREVVALANRLQITMPITEQVHSVLYFGHSPRESVQNLFSRTLRPENK